MPEPGFTIEREVREGALELRLRGRLTLPDTDLLRRGVRDHVRQRGTPVVVDLAGVERIDGASAAVLHEARQQLVREGGAVAFRGAHGPVARMLALYGQEPEASWVEEPSRRGFLEELGRAAAARGEETKAVLGFGGQLVAGLSRAVRRPRTVHWRELGLLMERAGADGVPIVVLINFLVGLIMGYQAAIQLERFGANIFIADLVGLSLTRELGPLMTAIIVAGRSGAAYAAELGTMQVREEIDALSTLSLDPARFLVFPRLVALLVVVPLLTLLADLVGCLGGLVVAVAQLDLTMTGYLSELRDAVDLWDVFGGVAKSMVFAVAITLISCQRGLATRGGADAVGRSTTTAVVITLFVLVALDAGFAVLFNALRI